MIRLWMRCVSRFAWMVCSRLLTVVVWFLLQVDAFLEAHDSGLTEADKEVANGVYFLLHSSSYL